MQECIIFDACAWSLNAKFITSLKPIHRGLTLALNYGSLAACLEFECSEADTEGNSWKKFLFTVGAANVSPHIPAFQGAHIFYCNINTQSGSSSTLTLPIPLTYFSNDY